MTSSPLFSTAILPLLLASCLMIASQSTMAFQVGHQQQYLNIHSSSSMVPPLCMAKGFGAAGGGGFGVESGSTKSGKKVKKSDIKKTQQKILKKYGGDIAQGTQRRIEKAMSELPPHLQLATQLYQQLQKWNARLLNMSVLQQANLPDQEVESARRAQEELERLYQEHNFSEHDLHNIFQQVTWDASADAKAARAITGDMPQDIAARVDKACEIAAEAVKAAGSEGRCLDIGCGFGVLVPHLLDCGLAPAQIYGIDLSPEMIKNAREQHRGVNFEAVDFMNDYQCEEGFHSVIFCSALHDLSDMIGALKKAAKLVKPNGRLVIAHPQGASHVLKQSAANPVLVKRGLPTAEEFKSMELDGLKLEIEPAAANSPEESQAGYLAVLSR